VADQPGTLERLAIELATVLQQAADRMRREVAQELFVDLGVEFPEEFADDPQIGPALDGVVAAAEATGTAAENMTTAIAGGDAIDIIAKGALLLDSAVTLYQSFDGLVTPLKTRGPLLPGITQAQVDALTDNLRTKLLELFLIDKLTIVPGVGAALILLGIISRAPDPGVADDPTQPPFIRKAVHFENVIPLLSDPAGQLQTLYGWGGPSFDGATLFDALQAVLGTLGLPVRVVPGNGTDPTRLEAFAVDLTVDSSTSPPDPPGLKAQILIPVGGNLDVPLALPHPAWTGRLRFDGSFQAGTSVTIKPPASLSVLPFSGAEFNGTASVSFENAPQSPVTLLGISGGTRIVCDSIGASLGLTFKWDGTAAHAEPLASVSLTGARLVAEVPGSDGFLSTVSGGKPLQGAADLALTWTAGDGFRFSGSASFKITVPVHVTIGPLTVSPIVILVGFSSGKTTIGLGVGLAAQLGPILVTVDRLGIEGGLSFPAGGGNIGPANWSTDLLPPTGVGIEIDAGPVSGGGFLFFEEPRYAGVLELSVFAVTVKAFGLIETRLPDGTPGFSFVIIIIAEFTPIQLGFGFTLLGVGGLLGVNRSVNEQGLSDAVRTGSLEHVLFPHDPIHDAPAIIHDLATIFPAARDHFIFGPMAKLGWGTPTLITADLGIVIEFPGPRVAVLGILRMLLPDPDAAILALQMAVAGLLDFPAKKFSLDASLFDSTIAGYVVSGDMAFRLELGNNPKFLLSVGGFNSGFSPPAAFPDLRRASVDLGVSGNPSLVASGYFAVTSNTAQIGASIQLHASGAGIRLDGWLGFDVMFVFSPFSFTASINAGVRVSFHGVGFGINLHGNLSGPNPWHLDGRVCVSVLWWDACLPVDITFGDRQQVALPEIDPWFGNPGVPVTGLKDAIADARNWEGAAPPSEFKVVSLAASSTDRTPIDPLGSATLRQKVVPLNRKLEKFGEFKPVAHDRFDLGPSGGTVGVLVPGQTDPTPVTELEVVQDDFAPGHFMQLSNAQKLSMPSYTPMDAGVSVAADRITVGSSDAKAIEYVTKFIDDEGVVHEGAKHQLTDTQLAGLLKRSPAALGGVRRSGSERFILANRPKKIRLGPALFVVADACTMVRNAAVTGAPISQTEALLALREHLRTNPGDADRFAVVPAYAEAA
jgi:hypothetical protein